MKATQFQIDYLALDHLLGSTIGSTNASNLVEMIALLFTRARPKRILRTVDFHGMKTTMRLQVPEPIVPCLEAKAVRKIGSGIQLGMGSLPRQRPIHIEGIRI